MFALRITVALAALAITVSAQSPIQASLRLWNNSSSLNIPITEYTFDLTKYNFARKATRIEFKGT